MTGTLETSQATPQGMEWTASGGFLFHIDLEHPFSPVAAALTFMRQQRWGPQSKHSSSWSSGEGVQGKMMVCRPGSKVVPKPREAGKPSVPFPLPVASSSPMDSVAVFPKELKKETTSVRPKIHPRDPCWTKLHSSVHLH